MIVLDHVTVAYPDDTKAILDLSLSIREGESIAVLGANGAGKTTLLKAVMGVEPIASGIIDVDGFVLDGKKSKKEKKEAAKEIWKRIGMVFQDPDDQLFMISVKEDVMFGLRNAGMDEKAALEKAEEMLKRLNIEHLKDKVPGRMSSGEKRLAALAGVLVLSPKYIFFDEPATFLDRKAKRNLISIISEIPSAKVITTHDMDLVDGLCDRVIVLKNGRIVFDDDRLKWKELFDSRDPILEEWGM